jgi:hypothetical protein
VAAVDGQLANQLLDPQKYTTLAALREGIGLLNAFSKVSGILLPVFFQSMRLVLEYPTMVANRVPFETKVKDLPPLFVVALVFLAGKEKRVIRLEVNDTRLLEWAEGMKVDFGKLDSASIVIDETRTEIPASLWS